MRVLVTGATGYVGRAVVAALQSAGHTPVALIRSGSLDGVETIRGDLRTLDLAPALEGVDAVIHTAAALSGTEDQMTRDTVEATTRLMQAVAAHTGSPRVVISGSMSVFGADCPPHSVISEDSPRETRPGLRDGYTRTKIAQEDAVSEHAGNAEVWMLRIGAVFGPDRLWNGHLGIAKGPLLLRIGKAGQIPLCHVTTAAAALVRAAETPANGIECVNVVDDGLPDRMAYVDAMKSGGWPKVVVPLPWQLFAGLGRLLGSVPGMPGLLRATVVRARLMPLRYSNDRMRERLGVTPLADPLIAVREAAA